MAALTKKPSGWGGSRTPKRTDDELRAAGSSYIRKKDAANKVAALQAKQKRRRYVPPTPSAEVIESYCRTLLPGYDPWRDAGREYRFEREKAREEVAWFQRHFTHLKGPQGDRAFKLQPFQIAFWANLFGWFDRKTGLRRYRSADLFIPEKNGKTPLAAAVADRIFIRDDDHGSEVYTLAFTREQARDLWEWQRGMILNSRELYAACKVTQHVIHRKRDGLVDGASNLKAIPLKDQEVAHGKNINAIIEEEPHTYDPPRAASVETLESKQKARAQPLIVRASTAGFDRESFCYRVWERSRAVRDGLLHDPRHLPAIWEMADGDDWTDPEVWRRVNPNMGVIFSEVDFANQFEKARESLTGELRFQRLCLNKWTQSQVRWLRREDWDECGRHTFDESELLGRPCYAGLDLGVTDDLTAFVLVFPWTGGTYRVKAWHWLPEERILEREQRDAVPYREWARDGWINLVPGHTMDNERLNPVILDAASKYKILRLGYDSYNSRMWMPGFEPQVRFPLQEVKQAISYISEPAKHFARLVMSHKLHHNNNPMLTWQADYCEVYTDTHDNILPKKPTLSKKIDGIMGIINALLLAIAAPPEQPIETRMTWL